MTFVNHMVYKYDMEQPTNANLLITRSKKSAVEMSRPRGRPREFDRDRALEQAMRLFWRFGYEGTSMADLRSSLGLTQASIYAAFGSKEQLFLEAVALYRRTAGSTTAKALQEKPTAREAIEAMLRDAIEEFASHETPPGCLIVLGAMNCSEESQSVQKHLRSVRLQTARAIAERLKRGQKNGDVSPRASVERIAEFYTTILHGLSIQARDGASLKTLRSVIECAAAAWSTLAAD